LLGGLFLLQRRALAPVINENQVALIESVLKNNEQLPPELTEKLEELKEALEEHPLLDAPVGEALAEADEKLQESLTSSGTNSEDGQAKIIDLAAPSPTPPGNS